MRSRIGLNQCPLINSGKIRYFTMLSECQIIDNKTDNFKVIICDVA